MAIALRAAHAALRVGVLPGLYAAIKRARTLISRGEVRTDVVDEQLTPPIVSSVRVSTHVYLRSARMRTRGIFSRLL